MKISLNQLYSLNLYFLVLKDVGVKPIVTSSEVIDSIAPNALKKGSDLPQAYSLCCRNCTTLGSVKETYYKKEKKKERKKSQGEQKQKLQRKTRKKNPQK